MKLHRMSAFTPLDTALFPHVVVLDTPPRCTCRLPALTGEPGQSALCGCGHTWAVRDFGDGARAWVMRETAPVPVPCRVAAWDRTTCTEPAAYWVRDTEAQTRFPACARHAAWLRVHGLAGGAVMTPVPPEEKPGTEVHVWAASEGITRWSVFAMAVESVCCSHAQAVTGRWYTAPTAAQQALCVGFIPRSGAREPARHLLAILAAEHGHPGVVWAEASTEVLVPPPGEDAGEVAEPV